MKPLSFFFFNDTATTEIYTLSLHDALPISALRWFIGFDADGEPMYCGNQSYVTCPHRLDCERCGMRSEEHTSELQSRENLVCRLLLEKKKKKKETQHSLTSNHSNGLLFV